MTNSELEALKYPIGHFQMPEQITENTYRQWIDDIETFPAKLRATVEGMSDEQLNTPYRPGGWTVKQVVHHVVDSHMNSYVRFKWTLTEDKPMIKAYWEDRWAKLIDYDETPVSVSLDLLKFLHIRWMILIKSLTEAELAQSLIHPEYQKEINLLEMVGTYAWHSNHHLAHIQRLVMRMGW
jgi:hypothetical protein